MSDFYYTCNISFKVLSKAYEVVIAITAIFHKKTNGLKR